MYTVALVRGASVSGRAVTYRSFSRVAGADVASGQMNGAYLSLVLPPGRLPFRVAVKQESHSRKHLAYHCELPLHHLPSLLQVLWWEVVGITNWGRRRVLKLKTASYCSVPTSLPFPTIFPVLWLTDEGMRVARELQGSSSHSLS